MDDVLVVYRGRASLRETSAVPATCAAWLRMLIVAGRDQSGAASRRRAAATLGRWRMAATGSAGTDGDERSYESKGRIVMSLLEVKNLHVEVEGKKILNGLTLTVEKGQVAAIMGPNGSGKSTLAYVLAGKDNYNVTEGDVLLDGESILGHGAGRARRQGRVPRVPISGGSAGRRHHDVPAHRAQRAAQDARREGILDAGIHEAGARDRQAISASARRCCGARSMSAFPAARRSATRSCRWRCLQPRLAVLDETDSGLDIDALKIVAEGVNRLRSPERSMVVITHYQRLLELHRARRRACAGQGPRREDRAARNWRSSSRPRATRNLQDEAA